MNIQYLYQSKRGIQGPCRDDYLSDAYTLYSSVTPISYTTPTILEATPTSSPASPSRWMLRKSTANSSVPWQSSCSTYFSGTLISADHPFPLCGDGKLPAAGRLVRTWVRRGTLQEAEALWHNYLCGPSTNSYWEFNPHLLHKAIDNFSLLPALLFSTGTN